jgi:hypothetical protein
MRVHDTGQSHTAIAPTYSDRRLSRRSAARFFGGLLLAIALLFAYPKYGTAALVASAAALLSGIWFSLHTWDRDPGSRVADVAHHS